ncbi:MAG: MFS transporter [Actinomycetota bacterium]
MTDAIDASLDRYRRHQRLAGALFWMPVVVLYLIEQVGLARALQIQAVYYVAVVVFEVPSGWASDRLSRVGTMRVAAAAWILAHALFLVGATPALIMAQVLLAAGYACLSGTDVTWHFDALESLGRAAEFDEREAASRQGMLLVTAGTALVGGGLAVVDLRLPFVAALIAAVVQLGVAFGLTEPPRAERGGRFRRDLVTTLRSTRDPVLAWLAVFLAAQVVVVHIAAEFTGPYLVDALGRSFDEPAEAALLTGVVSAAVAVLGAAAVRGVRPVVARIGLSATLLVAAIVPVVVVIAMASTVTIWLLPLLALRGVQGAVGSVVAPAVIGGRIEQHHRATFLSLTSLGGRLGHVVVLTTIGAVAADSVGDALRFGAGVAAALWLLVMVGRRAVPTFPTGTLHEHDHEHPALTHDHLHDHGDGHHDHEHDPPVTGPHRHTHAHRTVRHRHAHTRDVHHGHDH